MKIDIHTHTRKCKSGDAPTREISAERFCETIVSSEVRIVAITNHNVFDLAQFNEIKARMSKEVQAWPGIEFDVIENGARAHLLVIVSPSLAASFSKAVDEITAGKSADEFSASIEQVIGKFDALRPIYVAHYKQKKPSLSDEALRILLEGTNNPNCVIKEVTNSISAGIYISHGHASIYGSDVQDWAQYEEISRDLPDLRLPVESFEHFCLLLQKDPTTINTALNNKSSEELLLVPFEDGAFLKLRVFNDINVVFGPKGTGKSCILEAIAKHYSDGGTEAEVYESASDRLDEIFDVKGKRLTFDLNAHSIENCAAEIEALRSASEVNITSLSSYVAHFAAKTTNKNAKKLLLKDLVPEEVGASKHEFEDFHAAVKKTNQFLEFFTENESVKKELSEDEHEQVTRILSALAVRLDKRQWTCFSAWKEICFLNSAIEACRKETARKTGLSAKPTSTGFRNYALNRVQIELSARKLISCIESKIPTITEAVGVLGSDKGELEFRTEFVFQTGTFSDGAFAPFGAKKTTQKNFSNAVRKILKHAYSDDLFRDIAALNEIEDGDAIDDIAALLQFRRYFALNGSPYVPSSGEASMVMLQKELETDKEVYILDEPERSLGNEYISDVIVPLIKERARAGKKIFISTHDANIAVRTLPYSSVYRQHGPSGYRTYVGTPFSNNLINIDDSTDQLDWKKISMKTLEGGEKAFGERGKIYGND